MLPNISNLVETLGIETPLIGFYDTPDPAPFEPFTRPDHCIFSCYEEWLRGESLCLTAASFTCPGAGYWLCGTESMPRPALVRFLVEKEGLKASPALMTQWLEGHPPYRMQHRYIVIGPLREDHDDELKTITFYVTPDQLSALLIGCEYHHGGDGVVSVPFGSGCGQLAALFDRFDEPAAVLGATDIAMRPFIPADRLALTVTKPLFRRLCELDGNSFLDKPFLARLQQARKKSGRP